jgi:hypothetical protein
MARGSGAAWLSGELRWQLPVEASPIRCLDARLLDSYDLDVANKPACWLFVGFKARVSVTLPRALDHPVAHLVQCETSTLCSSVGRLPHGRAVARSYKNTSGILMPSPESVNANGTLDYPTFGLHSKPFQVAVPANFGRDLEEMHTPMQQGQTIIATIQQQLRLASKQGYMLEYVLGSRAAGPIDGFISTRTNHSWYRRAGGVYVLSLACPIVATCPFFRSF